MGADGFMSVENAPSSGYSLKFGFVYIVDSCRFSVRYGCVGRPVGSPSHDVKNATLFVVNFLSRYCEGREITN